MRTASRLKEASYFFLVFLDMNTPSMNKNILVIGVSTNSGTIHDSGGFYLTS